MHLFWNIKDEVLSWFSILLWEKLLKKFSGSFVYLGAMPWLTKEKMFFFRFICRILIKLPEDKTPRKPVWRGWCTESKWFRGRGHDPRCHVELENERKSCLKTIKYKSQKKWLILVSLIFFWNIWWYHLSLYNVEYKTRSDVNAVDILRLIKTLPSRITLFLLCHQILNNKKNHDVDSVSHLT